jgi:hypothetical protein
MLDVLHCRAISRDVRHDNVSDQCGWRLLAMRMHLMIPLLLPACAGGALGQSTMKRDCAAGDASCKRVGPLAPLAVGARFQPEVAIDLDGTTAPVLALASAVPGIVDIDNGALVGRGPGVSAVTIAVDSGMIVDFVHVWVAEATAVTVERDGERVTGAIGMVAGEEMKLAPALWHRAQRLEGLSSLEWTVDCGGGKADACPIALLRDGTPSRRRLRAQRPGKATIVIAGLGVSEKLDVEVMP